LPLPHVEPGLLPQLTVASVFILVSATFFSTRWTRFWGAVDVSARPGYPDETDWSAAAQTLAADSKPAEAFAGRAKDLHSAYQDTMKALDDKAAAILGLIGGGSGLVALAAGSDKVARPVVTPLLVLAAVYLFCVLAALIAVQIPRRRASVNVERLCNVALLKADGGKSQIDAIMGREYLEAARSAFLISRTKASYLWAAQVLFAFGVGAIVLNSLIPSGVGTKEPPVTSTTAHCAIGQSVIDCTLTPVKEQR
jgi:hypothetical protein